MERLHLGKITPILEIFFLHKIICDVKRLQTRWPSTKGFLFKLIPSYFVQDKIKLYIFVSISDTNGTKFSLDGFITFVDTTIKDLLTIIVYM